MTDRLSDDDLLKLCEATPEIDQEKIEGALIRQVAWCRERQIVSEFDGYTLRCAEFYAAAREAIPRLLAAKERLLENEIQLSEEIIALRNESERFHAALVSIAERDDERYAAGGEIARAALEGATALDAKGGE